MPERSWGRVRMLVHGGKLVTQRQLLKEVWGPGAVGQSQYLRVYIGQLRKKLEPDPTRPILLLTEPGIGYRMAILDDGGVCPPGITLRFGSPSCETRLVDPAYYRRSILSHFFSRWSQIASRERSHVRPALCPQKCLPPGHFCIISWNNGDSIVARDMCL